MTQWGEVLEASLSVVGSNRDQEEAAFIAIELLQKNLLNADTMFEGYSGAPVHGSGEQIDKVIINRSLLLTSEQLSINVTVC